MQNEAADDNIADGNIADDNKAYNNPMAMIISPTFHPNQQSST